ncbi:MAG: class I SAM-dependent methyltransferase [Acidimicrobiales bacterium]|nr:class I SAM-dependent methyltransferase [Acidimicrobiales bacterium]
MTVAAEGRRGWLQPKNFSQSRGTERFLEVAPYLRGEAVLDIGAATGRTHERIRAVARRAVGIDIDPQLVERARAEGFDVRVADAEDFDLGERFDVVWAGEVIEHLSNPAGFLVSARRHVDSDGRLILTTPNVFAVSNFVYRVGPNVRFHTEHMAWYCERTLAQLLARHGWQVEELRYLPHHTPGTVRRLAAKAVRLPLPDRIARNTLLVVARPATAPEPGTESA